MHVLILPSTYPRPYAPLAGIFYRNQAIALRSQGVRVGVIDPGPRTMRSLFRKDAFSNRFQLQVTEDHGIPTVCANDWCVPFARRLYKQQFVWRSLNLYQRYVDMFGRPDVIHAHNILWGGVAAELISKNNNVPFVVTEHSSNYANCRIREWQKPFVFKTMNEAAVIIAVSQAFVSILSSFYSKCNFRVIPNVLDAGFFLDQMGEKGTWGFRFVSIAHLLLSKGIDTLLKGFASAFKGEPEIILEIGGEGKDRQILERLLLDLGIGDQVNLLGLLNQEEVRDALHRSNVFVLPSCYETFGLAYAEAMAAGLPVIATKCGGPEDFVNKNNGYIVDVGSVGQVAEAMKNAYINREYWEGRIQSIGKYAEERFGQASIAHQLISVYNEVTKADRK